MVTTTTALIGYVTPTQSRAMEVRPEAPPPKGYPTSLVQCSFTDPATGVKMITRRGFYDSTADQGFGWDKAWNKHGINSCAAIQFVLRSDEVYSTSVGKDTVNMEAWAEEEVNDKVVQEILVTAAYEFGNWPTYFGWPAGNPLGLMTIYCSNSDQSARCPTWVTTALANGLSKLPPAASAASVRSTSQTTYTARYRPWLTAQ